MAIDILKTFDIIELMENHLEKIRPVWRNPSEYREFGYAKATFVKCKNLWKIYWLPSDLKWYPYEPAGSKELAGISAYGRER